MARKKSSAPKPKPINKTHLLKRLVEMPDTGIRFFCMREFAVLKRLEEKYPLEFLNIIDFGKKLPSLLVLDSTWGQTELARKFFAWNYVPPPQEKIVLSDEKFGEDVKINKKKTLREIL